AFWLWIRGGDAQNLRARLLWYAGAGLAVGIGYCLKPTVFIVCLAFVLADLLCGASRGSTSTSAATLRERFLCLGAMLAVVLLLMAGSQMLCRRVLHASGVTDEEIDRYSFPATHFFNMGLSESISPVSGGTVYGKWHGEDVLTAGNALTHADKVSATLHAAGEKLTDMGAAGYLSYLNRKTRWFMGDGTMYFGGESPVYDCFQQGPLAKLFQQFWWRGGQYYWVTAHILQGLWMLCVFLCALPVVLRRAHYAARHLLCLRLCVCGIILFVALFEGRSRYLTNFLPLFALLAAVSAAALCRPAKAAASE
ncbi:MAG: hypothetical protein RR825_03270, partial [Ruthenibacterium sp.]